MEISTEQLEALLDLLRDAEVEEFEGLGFHVRFRTDPLTPADPGEVMQESEPRAPGTVWETDNLWAGGEPPRFPSRKR